MNQRVALLLAAICASLLLMPGVASAQIEAAAKAQAKRVITATRVTTPLVIDGRFDDEAYRTIQPVRGFIQQDPQEGRPASEDTEVWILFDDKNLYIGARCLDREPQRAIFTELRRDNSGIFQNDSASIVIDTFHDLRNGFRFQTNGLGAIHESVVADEVNVDSWNTVWEVRSQRYDWGWGFEMAIPFKSLRYPGAGPQTWGFNMRRVIRHKNEFVFLTPMARSYGVNALYHLGDAATLVGVEAPAQSLNLEFKPFAVSSLTTDRTARVPFNNDGRGDAGFDFKYGLTRGLTLDATYRTDFAQVEEDQQQVNLTRYSLFFPEKRDFFLEGQPIFAFGGIPVGGQNTNPGDIPVLFFSRQIGLSRGQAVPVIGGARVTGKAGRYQLGLVNIQTDDAPSAGALSTNFTVVRVRRDVLRRSNVGLIATRRGPSAGGADNNVAYGADANLFLFSRVISNLYYARTGSTGVPSDGQDSYRGRLEYAGDRYGFTAEHLMIGDRFNPEVGFVRRRDFRRNFGEFQYIARQNSRRIRRYEYTTSVDYMTDASATTVQEKELRAQVNTVYQNGDSWFVNYTSNYELLPAAFVINPGTIVPPGGYSYQNIRTQYTLGQQRKVSGRLSAAYGSLYDGTKTEAGYGGRIAVRPQFAIEPSVSLNWVRLPYGDFSAPVINTRIIYTPNAQMALTSFIQYNGGSETLSSSIRLRWEYRSGSELFVVYSDGRNAVGRGYPDLMNRSVAIKVTRLLRF